MNPSKEGAQNRGNDEPRRVAYSPREVAGMTGMSYRKVLDLCADGRLRHRRAGQLVVIPADAVEEFLAGTDAA